MKPILIVGAGGHANVLLDVLLMQGYSVRGFTDANPVLQGQTRYNVPILGDDTIIEAYATSEIHLVNAIGSSYLPQHRQQVFEKYQTRGYEFITVQHPHSLCSEFAYLGEGCQLLAGSIIAARAEVDDNVLINHRSVVEHDCYIGAHCHVATGAVICGGCHIAPGVHIGAGATIIQSICIGTGAVIAAGATVVEDVPAHVLVAGTPAVIKKALT